MGAIKMVGRLSPASPPELDPEELPDIEVEESPLLLGVGFKPIATHATKGGGANVEKEQPPPLKQRKPNPTGPAAFTTTAGSYPDLTEGSHATYRGEGSGLPLPKGLQDIIHHMLRED